MSISLFKPSRVNNCHIFQTLNDDLRDQSSTQNMTCCSHVLGGYLIAKQRWTSPWTSTNSYERKQCGIPTYPRLYSQSVHPHLYWKAYAKEIYQEVYLWCLTSFQLTPFSLWWQEPPYPLQGHSRNIRRRSGTIWRRSSLLTSPWVHLKGLIYFDTISLPRATSHMPLHPYLIVSAVRNTSKISTILHWLH